MTAQMRDWNPIDGRSWADALGFLLEILRELETRDFDGEVTVKGLLTPLLYDCLEPE